METSMLNVLLEDIVKSKNWTWESRSLICYRSVCRCQKYAHFIECRADKVKPIGFCMAAIRQIVYFALVSQTLDKLLKRCRILVHIKCESRAMIRIYGGTKTEQEGVEDGLSNRESRMTVEQAHRTIAFLV